jgi:hypothetical protein
MVERSKEFLAIIRDLRDGESEQPVSGEAHRNHSKKSAADSSSSSAKSSPFILKAAELLKNIVQMSQVIQRTFEDYVSYHRLLSIILQIIHLLYDL